VVGPARQRRAPLGHSLHRGLLPLFRQPASAIFPVRHSHQAALFFLHIVFLFFLHSCSFAVSIARLLALQSIVIHQSLCCRLHATAVDADISVHLDSIFYEAAVDAFTSDGVVNAIIVIGDARGVRSPPAGGETHCI
jgi:hypothetical protein